MDQELTPEQLDAVARASVGGLCEINYALTGDPQWLPDEFYWNRWLEEQRKRR